MQAQINSPTFGKLVPNHFFQSPNQFTMNTKNFLHTVVLFLFFHTTLSAQQPQLTKMWQTDTLLTTCESVLFDAKRQVLYVSNIEGAPSGKDGKGSIGKVGLDGKIIAASWVSGLNAPKGMGLHKNTLWVTDLDELVAININTGTVTQKIKVEGAKFLNDLTITKAGIIYASDSDTKKVHRLAKGVVTTYLDSLQRPNGVLALGKSLYVLDNGRLLQVGADKKPVELAKGMEGGTDGIEQVKPNEFIVSCWSGVVYYVKSDGTTQQLLDTRPEKSNTADIGYDAKNRIVYVPTFFKNSVVAYALK